VSDKDTKDTAEPVVDDPSNPQDAGDVGADQVQHAFDEAEKKGHFGEKPDGPPNDAYTVKGSIKAAQQAAKDAANGK